MSGVETHQAGTTGDRERGERLLKGRTLAERRQERREALLAAALDVFGTKGYASSSVEEICRRAYVSTRNFYEEFTNREALLAALGERVTAQIYRALTNVEVEPGSDFLRRRTRARIGALVHTLVDDPRVARLVMVETVGVSPENEARRRQAHRLYADWVSEYLQDELAAKGIDARRRHFLTLALVGAVSELIGDWVIRPESRSTVDELIDAIVDLAMIVLQRS